MARRKPILRRYGRLVLDLPDQQAPAEDPRRRRWRWFRVSLIAFLLGLIFASAATYGFITAITTNLPDLRQFDGRETSLAQDGSIWVTGETGEIGRAHV